MTKNKQSNNNNMSVDDIIHRLVEIVEQANDYYYEKQISSDAYGKIVNMARDNSIDMINQLFFKYHERKM